MYGLCRIELVDKCFSHDTVEEIIDALVSMYQFWLIFSLDLESLNQ